MDFLSTAFYFIAAVLAAGVAVLALFRDRGAPGCRIFFLGLLLLSAKTILAGLSHHAPSVFEAAFWRSWWLLSLALVPGVWLLFALKFSRGNFERSVRKSFFLLFPLTLVPLLALAAIPDDLASLVVPGEYGWSFKLGISGFLVYLSAIICSALILINLERTFRAAVGTLRWRIKFLVLGTAAIFTAKLYTASQVLLFKTHSPSLDTIDAIALLVACLLFLRSLFRAGVFQVQVYPSEQVLQYSVAGILIGAYLVLVGVLSKSFRGWNASDAFPLPAFLLLSALALLAVILLSERTRYSFKRWISRHFRRSLYDYRSLWSSLTEKTASVIDRESLCRVLADWLSDKLHVLSATVWLIEPDSRSIWCAASTAITRLDAQFSSECTSKLGDALIKETLPFDIDSRQDSWIPTLQRCFSDHFQRGGNRVCVPLISAGGLVGFCTLGDRVNDIPLGDQEFELLKCVADHIASTIHNLQLSGRLIQAKEMEAFQTIAAFFIHDLKNTASTLNLTLQNLPKHFDNPEFRKDALNAISKSVNHIQDLISRLGLFRQTLELKRAPVDLNEMVRTCLNSLRTSGLPIVTELSDVKSVSADAEQLQKVITNLLLNSRDALKDSGRIELSTFQQNGCAVVSVSDNGNGMSEEFLSRKLFRPFQTTKKGGIGIGLFQSKAIVEAHGGRIEAESQLGMGATFRIYLPTIS